MWPHIKPAWYTAEFGITKGSNLKGPMKVFNLGTTTLCSSKIGGSQGQRICLRPRCSMVEWRRKNVGDRRLISRSLSSRSRGKSHRSLRIDGTTAPASPTMIFRSRRVTRRRRTTVRPKSRRNEGNRGPSSRRLLYMYLEHNYFRLALCKPT